MNMPKELQVYKLQKAIGEDSDCIDLNALVDESLHYDENFRIINEQIKLLKNKQEVKKDYNKEYEAMQEKYNFQRLQLEEELQLDKILKRHSIIGIAGNRGTGKTLLALSQLMNLKLKYPKINIAVLGVNQEINQALKDMGIIILESKMDILDLRLRDTIIFIDEFSILFDTQAKNKQLDKLNRFIDRIEHQNCKLIIATAREGFYNKFMCGRISAFMVKQIEYEALVNGTWLKERVIAIKSNSDYRLEIMQDEYYTITTTGELAEKHTFKYHKELDTKKNNYDLFGEKKDD